MYRCLQSKLDQQCGLFQCKALGGTHLLRNLMSELGEFKINIAGIT